MKIESICVRNYRSITELKLEKLSPITVLVGRNNTGKSTLLESFALGATGGIGWFDALGEDLLETIVKRRGGWRFADLMIRMGAKYSEIEIKGDSSSGIVRITNKAEDLPKTLLPIINSGINEYMERMLRRTAEEMLTRYESKAARDRTLVFESEFRRIRDRIISQINGFVTYEDSLNPKHIEYAALVGEKFREELSPIFERYPVFGFSETNIIRSSKRTSSNVNFMLNPSSSYLRELQRRLARSGDLIKLINLMRKRVDYFEDIREVEDNFLVFLKGLSRPVPLESMGDGFRAKLAILAAIATAKNGIALMEEPEIRLHPGFMSSISKQISETAETAEIQYVISTHSTEFLDYLLHDCAKLVTIVRMYRSSSGDMDYEVLKGAEALDEIDKLKADLRGI
jgi:predicted ATP-dependent endonuclease of OLD family